MMEKTKNEIRAYLMGNVESFKKLRENVGKESKLVFGYQKYIGVISEFSSNYLNKVDEIIKQNGIKKEEDIQNLKDFGAKLYVENFHPFS